MTPPLRVHDLGLRRYAEVLELQRAACRARGDGRLADDLLLLVEHPSVYTLGRSTKDASVPVAPALLAADGSDVVEIERGGDVTWHAPGQLVGYPILHLSGLREDLHWYLRELEQALIDALAVVGVPAERNPGYTGVWTRGRKLASIGIHVKRWVTMHGFALNVTNDLGGFARIVPCGIDGVTMSSVAQELGVPGDAALDARVRAEVVTALGTRFGRQPVPAGPLEIPEEES